MYLRLLVEVLPSSVSDMLHWITSECANGHLSEGLVFAGENHFDGCLTDVRIAIFHESSGDVLCVARLHAGQSKHGSSSGVAVGIG